MAGVGAEPEATEADTRLKLLGLEINAVMHCNLACVGCSHASPVAPRWVADPDVVHRDLAALASVVDVQEIRVVGGEPLLHPALADVLRAIREAGIGGKVRVITNGTRLHRTGWHWLGWVDEVYVSKYPSAKLDTAALVAFQRECRNVGVFVAVNPIDRFRLVHPRQRLSAADASAVYETCQVARAWSCHTVQEGYLYRCPMVVQPGGACSDAARCAIEPSRGLLGRLESFLGRPDPLPECSNCLGTVGRLVAHETASARTWRSLSFTGDIDWMQVEAVRADPFADNGC